MNDYAKLFLIVISFWAQCVYSITLYKNDEEIDYDFNTISMQELKKRTAGGDNKAKYIMALHEVHDNFEKNKGVEDLEKLARSDILDAKITLYTISSWVEVDGLTNEKSIGYLKEATEEGLAEAQLELARVYMTGSTGKKDPKLSHYWLEKSAEQGNAEALVFTATNYYSGRGVPRDDKKGFEWIIKAYKIQGKKFDKWRMMGQAYERGRGTSKNLTQAYMCYDLLGTAGIEDKARIAPYMTPEQRAEGLRLSQEWQEKNHVYTMQSLGLTRQKDGSYQ